MQKSLRSCILGLALACLSVFAFAGTSAPSANSPAAIAYASASVATKREVPAITSEVASKSMAPAMQADARLRTPTGSIITYALHDTRPGLRLKTGYHADREGSIRKSI
jgi:hypothetical protein